MNIHFLNILVKMYYNKLQFQSQQLPICIQSFSAPGIPGILELVDQISIFIDNLLHSIIINFIIIIFIDNLLHIIVISIIWFYKLLFTLNVNVIP